MTNPVEDFNPLAFEKKLTQLKDTQESIQSLSSWCLQKRQHHKKIVISWLNVLKRAKVEQRLTLFYLANDVIQYSKRKNYEFVESWGTTLQKATPLVRDDKVKHRILRIFRIWEERAVYDEEFLTDLTGLLSAAAGKQMSDVDPNDFQAVQLVNKIRQCSVLEADTDLQMKHIHENPLALKDAAVLCSTLKERRDVDEVKQELDDGVTCLEGCVGALQKELVARDALCHLLQRAHNHYTIQRGEVKVVANAYKNFGGRVRGLKRKLDELCLALPSSAKAPAPSMASIMSPVPSPPSPGEAVPSPGPDEDLDLPGNHHDDSYNLDKTFSSSISSSFLSVPKGFTSFLGHGDFPFFQNDDDDKAGNKIEVISSRPVAAPRGDFNIDDYVSTLIPSKTTASKPDEQSTDEPYSTAGLHMHTPPPPPSASLHTPSPTTILPGLDLLVPPPPPPPPLSPPVLQTNFYGTANPSPEPTPVPAPEPYVTDHGAQWSNAWETIQALDTPESPPPSSSPPAPPHFTEAPPLPPRPDVDQRKLLMPPPPPRLLSLLMKGDDIDLRVLPPLPPTPLASSSPTTPKDRNRPTHKADVDHRNLISLTGLPPMSPWTPHLEQSDQDYRSMRAEIPGLAPPPAPPQLQRLPPNIPQHPPNNIPQYAPNYTPQKQHPNNIPTQHPNNLPQHAPINISHHSPASNAPLLSSNVSHHPLNNISQLPPSMSHLPPNMPQHNMPQHNPDMSQHPPSMSHLSPKMPQHNPDMSQHPPKFSAGKNMSQHPPSMPIQRSNTNMSQHPPSISQLPPNMSHHPPNMHMSHPPPSVPDNVESIDMEMSDEELYELDEEFGRHSRIEMNLARMHGNPPMAAPFNQPLSQQHQFRKTGSEHPAREQQAFNNNKVLVGGNLAPKTNTPLKPQNTTAHKNEIKSNLTELANARSNLVRINSVPPDPNEKFNDSPKQRRHTFSEDESSHVKDGRETKSATVVSPSKEDIFRESFSSAMNPSNPNVNDLENTRNQADDYKNWKDEQDEPPKWRQQSNSMNPSRPNQMMGRAPQRGFRHMDWRPVPPPIHPPYPRMFFNGDRGLRPWGPRPHRGGL